jgi:hypothetical protein
MGEVFFLAYGGLHWSYSDILAMPIRIRKKFVEMLSKQIELEKQAIKGK